MKTTTLEPFPRSLRLRAKDAPDILAKFAGWVKRGELPPGAILARFVGSDCQTQGRYVNEATGARMGAEIDDMDALCHLTLTCKGKPDRCYLIVSPVETN